MAISSTSSLQASSTSLASSGKAEAQLSAAQQRQLQRLQQIDRNVRAHEQAHITVGRELITSGPSYSYTYGPDGKQYAVGGEVGIDTSATHKPEDNINKGQRIQATALAPQDPSPQDYRVAQMGVQLEVQGRSDLARLELEQAQEPAAQSQAAAQNAEPNANFAFLRAQSLARAYSVGEAEGASVSVFA